MENNDNNRNNQDPNKPNFNFGNNKFALFFLASLVLMFIVMFFVNDSSPGMEIPYSTFLAYLDDGRIGSVKIYDNEEIHGTLNGGGGSAVFKTTIPYYDDALMIELREKGIVFEGAEKSVSPLAVFMQFLPWVIGFVFIWFMFRQVQGGGGKAFSFGKSRAKKYSANGKKVTLQGCGADRWKPSTNFRKSLIFLRIRKNSYP